MTTNALNDLGNIAVLIVDIQNDFCHDDGIFAQQGLDVTPAQEVAPQIQEFIEEIRQYGVPIIYTKQIETEDITPANLKRQFARGKLRAVCAPGSWGSDFYQLQPTEHDYVLEKRTYDVFSNPELKRILGKHQVKTIVITGVNTDVCIDTTVRRSFTEGYQVVIPHDLVATMNRDGEKHYLAVFERFFGDVTDSNTVLSCLKQKE